MPQQDSAQPPLVAAKTPVVETMDINLPVKEADAKIEYLSQFG
jgi:hypothetical protein